MRENVGALKRCEPRVGDMSLAWVSEEYIAESVEGESMCDET